MRQKMVSEKQKMKSVLYSLYRTQTIVRDIVTAFYNGTGSKLWNKLSYPDILFYPQEIKKKIVTIGDILSCWNYNAKEKDAVITYASIMKEHRKCSAKEVAEFLSLYWKFLDTVFSKDKLLNDIVNCVDQLRMDAILNKERTRKIKIKKIDLSYYKRDKEYMCVLQHLGELGIKLRQKNKGIFLLFGSLATRDYIKGHSDLDTAFIISKEVCHNAEKILELRNEVAKIMRESYFVDPLQHHGPFIFSEYDLAFFPQTYLPFVVFENMVSLGGDVTLDYCERSSSEEILRELHNYKKMFVNILNTSNKEMPSHNYGRKYLYQAILLFPAVYLMAKGTPCYKRESFLLIRGYLGNKGNELLEVLSSVWRNNEFKTHPAHPIIQKVFRQIKHPFVYPFLYRLFFYNTMEQKKRREIESLLKEGASECINLIDKELKKYEPAKRT